MYPMLTLTLKVTASENTQASVHVRRQSRGMALCCTRRTLHFASHNSHLHTTSDQPQSGSFDRFAMAQAAVQILTAACGQLLSRRSGIFINEPALARFVLGSGILLVMASAWLQLRSLARPAAAARSGQVDLDTAEAVAATGPGTAASAHTLSAAHSRENLQSWILELYGWEER